MFGRTSECRTSLLVLLLVACAGAAHAFPARRLLGGQLGYVPQGCPLTVSVVADESQPSWFQEAPEIRGRVTLSNPSQYDVPITNIILQARSSDGLLYSTLASCSNGASTVVPYNPVPYTYGSVTCQYRIVLDRRVFGSYGEGSSSRRRLAGTNSNVQANFFPGSSSGGSGGYGYFPAPGQRASWSVTAIATISYSGSQCLSAPTPVNTDCWWTWLVSWHQKMHHRGWWFSGRRLMAAAAAQHTHHDSSSDSSSGSSSGSHQHHQHHHHMHSSEDSSSSGGVSRSLLSAHGGHASSGHSGHGGMSGAYGHGLSGHFEHGGYNSRRDYYRSVTDLGASDSLSSIDTIDGKADSIEKQASRDSSGGGDSNASTSADDDA